jgi:hypothetical protein
MKNKKAVVAEVKAVLGRPVNPNSARQKRLAEIEAKRAAGEIKRGRPIKQGSKRQEVLAAREAKRAAGAPIKRGRPVNPDSARQARLAAKANVSVEDAVKNLIG